MGHSEDAQGSNYSNGRSSQSSQTNEPAFLGAVSQALRAIGIVKKLRAEVLWHPHGGHWFLRAGTLFYRGLAEVVPSGRFFEELKNWMEEIVVPAPRDVIDELSRRGYDIITSPTRITSRPVRVVARRTDVPTVPPVEVAEETLYLALLGVLEIVVSGSSEEAAEA